ncbi:hypothetical protein V1506DRAFT_544022 [Lipomyces tetrasporus]
MSRGTFLVFLRLLLSMAETESTSMLGESKTILLARYFTGAQQALTRANFLRVTDVGGAHVHCRRTYDKLELRF